MQQSQHDPILAPIGDADSSVLAGRHFGAWVVARIDPTGRRATVVCRCSGAASSPVVKAAAIRAGITPLMAWRRQRSRDACRSGDLGAGLGRPKGGPRAASDAT